MPIFPDGNLVTERSQSSCCNWIWIRGISGLENKFNTEVKTNEDIKLLKKRSRSCDCRWTSVMFALTNFLIDTGKSLFTIQNGRQKGAENVWKYCFKYFSMKRAFFLVKCNTDHIRSERKITFKNKHTVTKTKKSTPTVGVGKSNQNYSKGSNQWQTKKKA